MRLDPDARTGCSTVLRWPAGHRPHSRGSLVSLPYARCPSVDTRFASLTVDFWDYPLGAHRYSLPFGFTLIVAAVLMRLVFALAISHFIRSRSLRPSPTARPIPRGMSELQFVHSVTLALSLSVAWVFGNSTLKHITFFAFGVGQFERSSATRKPSQWSLDRKKNGGVLNSDGNPLDPIHDYLILVTVSAVLTLV